jgi:hypothetical protein
MWKPRVFLRLHHDRRQMSMSPPVKRPLACVLEPDEVGFQLMKGDCPNLLLAQLVPQPLVAEGSTEPAAAATEEAAATEAQEEAPVEAGLVDIASILGAPTVMVVRSSLSVLILPE